MASRVNTRFVIILIAGVIALLGMLVLAYSVAVKSPADLIKAGDAFMAQGEYEQAVLAYSKAVNKDSTNEESIQKWVDALEHTIPETETLYRQKFLGNYLGSIKRVSIILRDDIEAHERYLSIRFEMLDSGYSRDLADAIISDTGVTLAYFREDPEQVGQWEHLKRYRGLAILEIAKRKKLLENNELALAADDLERAILADPSDIKAVIGFMNLQSLIAEDQSSDHDKEAQITSLAENLKIGQQYLMDHPSSIEMMMQMVYLKANIEQLRIATTAPRDQRSSLIAESFEKHQDSIKDIAQLLVDSSYGELSIQSLHQFYILERAISPKSKLSSTRRVVDTMIESQKNDAELLWFAGRVAFEAGDKEEAIGWYAQVDDLEPKTLSYQGFRQYDFKRRSLLAKAKIQIELATTQASLGNQAQTDTAISIARETRNSYTNLVADDNPNLLLLDGSLAHIEGKTEEAYRLFKKFNELTLKTNAEGLWYEGATALQLKQYGVAKEAFLLMIPIDSTGRKIDAMLKLAQIHTILQDYQAAADLYKDILILSPSLEIATNRLRSVTQMLNPELIEDPVLGAIFQARQMRVGSQDVPGDYSGAVQLLREAIEDHNYDPRITQELAGLLLDQKDIVGAREILAKSNEIHPGDENIVNMIEATSSDDTTDILISSVRLSDKDPVEKLILIAQIASRNQRDELYSETIAQLNDIAPQNKRVIEMTFLEALKENNIELATTIANGSNLNETETLSYQARLEITQGNTARAAQLLEQAAASGTANASIFHMLAVLQREQGDLNESIDSFERALEISPDMPGTITEYVSTLISIGRFNDALNSARRFQRYGTSSPAFMNLWLNLESIHGGSQGQEFAIRQREKMLELNSSNIENKYQLTRMYISEKQWDQSRILLDELISANNQLSIAELNASWYASQGVINGEDGVSLANKAFVDYIATLNTPIGAEPYVANARFMLRRGRPDLAIAAAKLAIENQSAETMIGSQLLGDLYLQLHSASNAITAYKEVVDAGADKDFVVRPRLIQAYLTLNRFKEAQEIYQQLPETLTSTMPMMFQAATIAQGLDNVAGANTILNNAVALFPSSPSVYITRAEFMIGDPASLNDLLSDIERAMDLSPNNFRAYTVRASAYFSVNRDEEALKDLQTAIRLNPNLDSVIFSVLNELLLVPGREGEALDIARDVLSKRPDDARLMARIGGLFASRKDWDRASEMYELAWNTRHSVNDGAVYIDTLVRKSPPDVKAANEVIVALSKMVGDINQSAGLLSAQALVLHARGRDDFAEQQLTKAFDLSSNTDEKIVAWSGNLARYFEDQSSQDHVDYLEALKRRNTNADVQAWIDLFIGKHLASVDNTNTKAINIFERLEGYTQNTAIQLRAFRVLGSTLFDQGDYDAAAKTWSSGIEIFSDDWEMNNNLAFTLSTKLDRPQEAMPFGLAAIEQNIARSEAYETMAEIYIRLGKFDEAEQMVEIGSNYISNISTRVSMIVMSGQLHLARGNMIEARSRLNDAKATLRASPSAYPNLEEDIEAFEQEINSAEG